MPGSPPISTTPPSTMPPPSTRSSSSCPVGVRSKSLASISPRVATSAVLASEAKRLLRVEAAGSATDSISVFQAPQAGHLPSHLELVPPQSLQTKIVFSLAMRQAYHPPGRRASPGAGGETLGQGLRHFGGVHRPAAAGILA
jgi:hypothetical protein